MIDINIPPDLESDGCTFPGILKIFRGVMNANRNKEYCREHDFLRRYRIINPIQANWLLFRRVWSSSWVGKLQAPFYFFFTTVSYPLYSGISQLPSEWIEYAERYQ